MLSLLKYIGNELKTPVHTVSLIALFFGAFMVILWAIICVVRLIMG